MKLQLKHLAPYLPYKLNYKDNNGRIVKLNTLDFGVDLVNMGWGNALNVWKVKPILRPLSDYRDVNSKAMNELNCDVMDMIRISELANKRIGLSSVQYGVIEIMCDNHIDFNRLIESGLAIDINTL